MTPQTVGATRILLFSLTPSNREPRLLKQIETLRHEYSVTTAGFGPAPVEDVPHVELDPSTTPHNVLRIPGVYTLLRLLHRYEWLSRLFPRNASAYQRLSAQKWDIIVAHDVATVPVAFRLRPRNGVLIDLHEYATRQGEHSARWMRIDGAYARWVLQRFGHRALAISTVGHGIADEYRREFGLKCDVVVNATPFRDLEPVPTPSPIRMVHSGLLAEPRKLEIMIEAVLRSRTPLTLDLYLVGDHDDPYARALKDLVGDDDRVVFRDPVPYRQLVETLGSYDVGLAMIAPTTFNLLWCLPNKFFDYVQARLAIISGPSPEMARIIDEFECGAVCAEFTSDSLVKLFDAIDPKQVDAWKANTSRHAYEMSSEVHTPVWNRMIARILDDKQEPRR